MRQVQGLCQSPRRRFRLALGRGAARPRTSVRTLLVLAPVCHYVGAMVDEVLSLWRRAVLIGCAASLVGCGASTRAETPVAAPPAKPRPAPAIAVTSPADTGSAPHEPVSLAASPRPFEMPPAPPGSRSRTQALAPAPDRPLKLLWKTRVGLTTFRTTMALTPNWLVIGTHGVSYGGNDEASDGVYVLDAKSGKLVRLIPAPGHGDRDVGGVAFDGADGLVFTTDNGLIVRARASDGAIEWQTSAFGKVRPAPALGQLNGVGALDAVVGDESGFLHALDGDNGRSLWTRPTGKNDYDASGFVAAAAIADLNADGRDDVIAGARDGVLVAYSGWDGRELWRAIDGSGIHASPLVGDFDADGRLDVLAAWSYSRVAVLDAASGRLRYEQRLEQDSGGIEGLFASPLPLPRAAGPAWLVQGTSWWGGARGKRGADTVDGVVMVGQAGREFRSDEGRVSASPVIMDLDDDGVWEAVLGTEAGELLALGGDGTRRSLAKLGGDVEATALVADVDRDGTFELLVAARDGWLRCFRTESRTAPLVARFRGNSADNRGALTPFDWRWTLAAR